MAKRRTHATGLATTYHAAYRGSSMKLLSRGITGLAAISPRSSRFVCSDTGAELATDASRSPHLRAPTPTPLDPPTMANGGSLGGLCGEGQRLAVALLQYICAKIGQHWWGTPADRPTSSPRRLRTSIPHHGERGEPGRAVWREAAPSSGAPGAFSASRSEGPDWLAERATRREGDPSPAMPITSGR